MKDCNNCLDVVNQAGVDKLEYGDWLRTNPNAHQSKYVHGSLHWSFPRPPRHSQSVTLPARGGLVQGNSSGTSVELHFAVKEGNRNLADFVDSGVTIFGVDKGKGVW